MTLALSPSARYCEVVTVNPVTDLGRSNFSRRTSALHPKAGAFFASAHSCYGGCAWDTFGCAGCLESRSANLRTAATLQSLGRDQWQLLNSRSYTMSTRNPSKARAAAHRAMALAALRSNSSLAVRLNRYNHHRAIQRSLEAQPNACDWLENLEGDAWADACEEIAAAQNARALEAQGGAK